MIGSANVDYALALPRLPMPGETVTGGTLHISHGGKGANQAVAARLLGAEVRLIACVGEDRPGTAIRESLYALGVDVDGVLRTADAPTGTALIMVDSEGRNQIGVAPGANHRLTVDMVRPHETSIQWADVVLCQLETPLAVVLWALVAARRQGKITILNPAPFRPMPEDVWKYITYLTPNESELFQLTSIEARDVTSAREGAQQMLERGVGTVIVTLGARGALMCDGKGAAHFPAFPVEAVDTTAAGDAFNGGLAVGLAAGGTLEQAVPLASAAGALTCTKRGAQDALPDRAAVERFLQSLQGGGT
ncbi:MAG TPA: ribokinase [Methylomirabilota bacterium]|nr:ribokinase [Methylomirabilota bacterium]